MKVISPKELLPASVKPKGGSTCLYFAIKSSNKRKEKISDIEFVNLSLKIIIELYIL
jgi:hypothetical protein